jgi:hypothetical protein
MTELMMHRHYYDVPQLLLEVAYVFGHLIIIVERSPGNGGGNRLSRWIELKASTAHIWLIDVSATVLVIVLTVGL